MSTEQLLWCLSLAAVKAARDILHLSVSLAAIEDRVGVLTLFGPNATAGEPPCEGLMDMRSACFSLPSCL